MCVCASYSSASLRWRVCTTRWAALPSSSWPFLPSRCLFPKSMFGTTTHHLFYHLAGNLNNIKHWAMCIRYLYSQFCFPFLSSNFEMAVSYGATFPVIVLLLSIAFTGYLEVNSDQFIALTLMPVSTLLNGSRLCHWFCFIMFSFHTIVFTLIFRSGILRYHQVFSGCQVCPEVSPLRRHCDSLWSLFVSSSHCSWPSSITWVVLVFPLPWSMVWPQVSLNAQHIICFLLKVFLPGNNCTALTNRTELEDLKLYTGPVSTFKKKKKKKHVLDHWEFHSNFDFRVSNSMLSLYATQYEHIM